MAFTKTGTPVQFNIISNVCSCCNQTNKEMFIVDGKSICSKCKKLVTENK